MKLLFQKYDPNRKQLQFVIQTNQTAEDTRLQNALLEQLCRFPNIKFDWNNETGIYTISEFNSIESFLKDTKNIFLAASITPENWDQFLNQTTTDSKFYNRLINESNVVLQQLINNQYLGVDDQLALLKTNKMLYQILNNPKRLLEIHFPNDYAQLQNQLKIENTEETNQQQETKQEPIDYIKAFNTAYARDYKKLNARERRLMTLFKAGDLAAIREANVMTWELLINDNSKEMCVIDWASRNKHQAVLNYCYDTIVSPIYKLNDNEHHVDLLKNEIMGGTLLHWAIRCYQSTQTVGILLAGGANINAKSTGGITPLYVAAYNNYLDMVKYLCEQPDILINEATTDGTTPLYIAVKENYLDIFKYLCAQSSILINAAQTNGNTPLHIAVLQNNLDALKYLCTQPGILINAATTTGTTPLHTAARKNYLDIVKYLCTQAGILINVTMKNGSTPLYISTQNMHWDITKHLCAQPAMLFDYLGNPKPIDSWAKVAIKEGINAWLDQYIKNKEDPLFPIADYLTNFNKNKSTFGKLFSRKPDFHDFLCTYLLIDQNKNAPLNLPILLDKIIAIYPRKPAPEPFFNALNKVRKNFVDASPAPAQEEKISSISPSDRL